MPEVVMTFMVIRGDDNGQNFIIEDGLDERTANSLHQRLLRGHKQWYAIHSYPDAGERQALVEQYNLK